MKKILLFMVAALVFWGLVSCDQEVKTKTYKVSYNANGAVGVVPAYIEVEEGGTITVSSHGSLSMKGYDFAEWNTNKDGSGNVYRESQFFKVDLDTVLYAQWCIHSYSISYDLDGGSYPKGRNNPNSYTIETGTFVLDSPERDGYEFLGWTTPENDKPNKNVSISRGTTGDFSFLAVWKPRNSYSISYDVNAGEGSIETVLKLEGESVEIASASSISRKGYEFVCWNTESDGTGKDYNPSDLYEEDENLQLYAKWSIVRYSIEYNLNDGKLTTGENNPVEYTVETADIVLANPTRCGYEFVGWRYTDDSDVLASTTFTIRKGTTGNLSIVAVWKALDTYTVSYDANGGTGTIETQSKYKGKSLTISSGKGVERNGYMFLCWNTEKDGTGKNYKPNGAYSADADLRLYAKWSLVKYSIAYDLAGGTLPEGKSNPSDYTIETETFSLVNPERERYGFRGWKESGSVDETAQENVLIEKGSTGDKSFTAVWKQLKKYTITFDSNGADEGSVPDSLIVYEGDSSEVPSCGSLFKNGYVFYGWNTDSDGSGALYMESELIVVGNNIVLYAIWRVDPFEYTYLPESDSYSVRYKKGSASSIVIPSIYKGKLVTSIGSGAFKNCSGLESVTIPEGVTSIGSYAFSGCSGLTSITIPGSVTNIGSGAFKNCSGLESVTIPEGVMSIGEEAFGGCSGLTSIVIPEGVTSIGSYAFSGCSGLTSITIPGSVTSIGSYAFWGCSSLTSIAIPSGVTNIGDGVFYGCTCLTEITIPSSVTRIGKGAFDECKGLAVIFADGTTEIPKEALKSAYGVVSVSIPSSVTAIGYSAFYLCSGLESISVSEWNPKYYAKGNCLVERDTKNLVLGCKNSVIPEGVTSIGDYAFSGCSGLTSVTIPSNVTSIGHYAFVGCDGVRFVVVNSYMCANLRMEEVFPGSYTRIETVEIPKGVTDIGSYAFSGCSGLESITIPSSVTSIGGGAFSGCSGLESITIPEGVTSIGYNAFAGCSSLESITIPSSVTSIGGGAFSGCSGLESVTIPSSVTSIGDGAFWGCSGLESITIPEGVTSIEYEAFRGCSGLTSIMIPESVTSINPCAFLFCDGLESIDVEERNSVYYSCGECLIERDSRTLFFGCKNSVIPEDVTSIGDCAFYGCSGLESITMPSSVTSIGNYAFSSCSGLESITIPSSVTSIGNYAFSSCSVLESITISENVTSIVDGAFWGCSGLESITIPEGVMRIEDSAFFSCSSLNEITIPESVTSIGERAFKHCSSLNSIVYPGTKTQWDSIQKSSSWNYNTGLYTIHCTDGDIAKQSN